MSSAGAGDAVFEELGNAAALECLFGSCFPPAITLSEIIPRGIGGPCAIGEASTGWKEGAEGLQQLQEQLRSLTEGLSADAWAGDDRDGFDKEISSLLAEFGDSHNTAEAIGIVLEVLPPFFAVWPTMSLVMGSGIAIVAGCFYAAAASGIGDITGVAEEIYAMGLEFSESCLGVMGVSTTVLASLLGVAQLVIGGAVYADITTQQDHGNDQILGDLGQAEVDGLGEVATNVAQFAITKGLDRGARGASAEQQEVPEFLHGALGGLVSGEGHLSRVGAHAVATQADVAQHQAFDLSGAGESLQDKINGLLDRSGPSVELGDEGGGDGGTGGDEEQGG